MYMVWDTPTGTQNYWVRVRVRVRVSVIWDRFKAGVNGNNIFSKYLDISIPAVLCLCTAHYAHESSFWAMGSSCSPRPCFFFFSCLDDILLRLQKTVSMPLRPLPMETRSPKVLFQRYCFQRMAENFLVPPLWEKIGKCFFVFLFVSPAAAGGAICFSDFKLSTRW